MIKSLVILFFIFFCKWNKKTANVIFVFCFIFRVLLEKYKYY